MVRLKPCSLNVLQMCFFTFSIFLGVLLRATSPSSRYKPMLLPTTGVSFDRRYEPTSSHVSAPSKLPMVTSNNDFDSLLHHAVFSLKSRDFLALMMFFSSSVIVSYLEAN